MAEAIPADIRMRYRIVAPVASAEWLAWRNADHDLRRIGQRRAIGIAGKDAGGTKPGAWGVSGEIAGEEAVVRHVAIVVAAVVVPAARLAIAQRSAGITTAAT